MIFTPHSAKQEQAIDCSKRFLILGAGTQWGKTRVGAIRMKLKMHTFVEKDDAFIITAPNYKTMYQSTLPAFLKLMDGWGTYNKKEETFQMHNGGTCFCRTETDPDSIVGITNVRHIWGDEAGKYGLYFWENMQARSDLLKCQIDLTTSPYSLNWVYKDLIKPTLQGKRSDVLFVKAASWENPYHSLFDPKNLAEKRSTMDPRRFDMLYGGEWGQMEGLVYDSWDEDENLIEPTRLPNGTIFYGGIDWGYTEPFVLTIRAVTPSGDHYQVYEFYKTMMTVPQQMEICKQQMQIFGIKRFFAGHERPENIELFNQNGLPTEGVPEKDIMVGTHLHYELIKSRRYKIFRGTSPYTLDELAAYHYPEPDDLKPDQDSKELTPVGQNDHAMSANRFITLKTHRSGSKKAPFVPGESGSAENQARRLERLMKLKRSLA
jgi:hypothetical protein